MTETSARFALPFILPGQAQKEAFHNEALAAIDGALHPAIEDIAADPPGAPDVGASWIVGESASGAWSGGRTRSRPGPAGAGVSSRRFRA